MKKPLAISALPAALIALAGCGGSGAGASHATSSAATTTAQQHVVQDASAQALARTAQTAAETIAVDDGGDYSGITPGALAKVERGIGIAKGATAYLSAARGTGTTYTLTATSTSGDTFTVSRHGDGTLSRTCTGSASSRCKSGSW